MSEELESPFVGEWVHFVGAQQQPNGQVAALCLPALVVMVPPPGQVKGSDGLPVTDAVVLEIHRPDGIDFGKLAPRGIGMQPGSWHSCHSQPKIIPANGHALGRMTGV